MVGRALQRGAARLRRRSGWPPAGPPPVVPTVPPGEVTGPPDFVGVGAMKAGTSWWYEVIAAHPGVHHPPGRAKELHYFDAFEEITPADPERYHRWFPRPPGHLVGEWTPRYMYDVWTPPMLHAAAPTAKVLVLLRDPIARFASGLAHDLARHRGRRTPRSMLVADHVARSLYHRQLAGLLRHIDRERVLVLQFEQCVADPTAAAARTFAFLGLPPLSPEIALPGSVNVTAGPKPPLSAASRAELAATFAPDLAALAQAFPEVDLSLWPTAGA